MTYRTYLVDLDDTLFDFQRAEEKAFGQLLEQCGILWTQQRFDTYRRINEGYWQRLSRGETTKQILLPARFEDWLKQENLQGDPEQMNHDYLTLLSRQGELLPGALEMMKTLHKRGQVVIVTNGVARAQYGKIENAGLTPYFHHLLISELVGVEKPHPRIFEEALAAAGETDKRRALMVGDSPGSDIQGACNAGIDSCLYDPLGRYQTVKCTHHVRHLDEVAALRPVRGGQG